MWRLPTAPNPIRVQVVCRVQMLNCMQGGGGLLWHGKEAHLENSVAIFWCCILGNMVLRPLHAVGAFYTFPAEPCGWWAASLKVVPIGDFSAPCGSFSMLSSYSGGVSCLCCSIGSSGNLWFLLMPCVAMHSLLSPYEEYLASRVCCEALASRHPAWRLIFSLVAYWHPTW
eukprot:Gb_36772 [translate_table: standard]